MFATLFITTGVGKLLDNRGFSEVILTYQLGIPAELALPFGVAFSLFELWLGLRVARNIGQTQNGLMAIALHLGYTSLAVITLARGIALENCGCFGVFLKRPLTYQTVIEDLVLVALSIVFWYFGRSIERSNEVRP